MAQERPEAIGELVDLLRTERAAIRAGDFSDIVTMADRKEQLLAGLAGTPVAELEQARCLAIENQRLFEAAMKGVRAAQARLRAITQSAGGFTTYDRSGAARSIRRDGGEMEHRV